MLLGAKDQMDDPGSHRESWPTVNCIRFVCRERQAAKQPQTARQRRDIEEIYVKPDTSHNGALVSQIGGPIAFRPSLEERDSTSYVSPSMCGTRNLLAADTMSLTSSTNPATTSNGFRN